MSREMLSDRLVLAMRSTVSMCSMPNGEYGAKIVIEMSEETSLYEILEAAWDAARLKRALALSDLAVLDGETLP